MERTTTKIHRRKSSAGDDENTVVLTPAEPQKDGPPSLAVPPPPRSRVHSTPSNLELNQPQSAGPHRTAFSVPKSPTYNGLNGSPSPSRSSFSSSHARTRSISTPYSPPLPSPLSFSFPASASAPDSLSTDTNASPKTNPRRHARLHSRNLSLEIPSAPIPSADPSVSRNPRTPLGAGFTFGARPPSTNGNLSSDLPMPPLMSKSSSSSSSTRRGHHHKHSLSHNFFSFLEPGSQTSSEELLTQPTPSPISQWTPISQQHSPSASPSTEREEHAEENVPMGAISLTFAQFVLGAWLWVCGQQIGSLGCTGMGYWIVFDSFGLGLGSVLPGWLGPGDSKKQRSRRPYGNARVETVLMFAQAVYLMFSSVYVCKETVEHVLLSMGGGDGHHHHHGDEETGYGIDFPVVSILLALCSVVASAFYFDNHSKLVNVTGNRIPSPGAFIRSLSSTHHIHDPPPTTPLAIILSNPYISSPLLFGVCLLLVASLVPSSQHTACDLVIATLITVVTFNVSYSASFILGTVLLQTSPPRGASSGRMEAFLRAMREVERHPQVLHLPAPHIWQLTPAAMGKTGGTLIVSLELHVRQDMPDDDVLALTKWAYDRCTGALGGEREVTVGVVRG
ncbi:hypothetical protein BDZ89DRAFT_1065326 [Hymenopellis radicata]|nr:hypothetical protein BDZ89DRAFT_1065326 [Hymenopellis radicata]